MITWCQSVRKNQTSTRLMKSQKCQAVSTANTFTGGWMKIPMIRECFMKVLRINKKGNLEENPELNRIATEWNDKFEVTRAIRKEIAAAEDRLSVAHNDFLKINKEWELYEKLNGKRK